MMIQEFAVAVLLAAVILLDKWTVGEFGISQPIVACPVLGWAFGSWTAGLQLGLALQLGWLAALPLGSSRQIDYQSAGVAAILGYRVFSRLLPAAGEGQLLLGAILLGAVCGLIGEFLDFWHKRLNGRLFLAGVAARSMAAAFGWHFAGLGTGLLRGAVAVVLYIGLALLVKPLVSLLPAVQPAKVVAAALMVGAAAAARLLVDRARVGWFACGGAAGAAIWLLLAGRGGG